MANDAWAGGGDSVIANGEQWLGAGQVVSIQHREGGAWVSRAATPKVLIGGVWTVIMPQRWDAATGSWVAL